MLRYVEPLSEAGTSLADLLNILLDARSGPSGLPDGGGAG